MTLCHDQRRNQEVTKMLFDNSYNSIKPIVGEARHIENSKTFSHYVKHYDKCC